jgi:CheY-like chemotaxis protein
VAASEATHRQIAEVLEELSQEVEALGASLCGDMDIAMRHMDTLQAIDLIAQKQRSLAAVLNADCVVEGVERIGLEKLRERMRLAR